MSIKTCSFYLGNSDLLVLLDHKQLQKIFTGSTDTEKCKTWDVEDTNIHICKTAFIKGIANILADSVLRLKAVGLYHDLDFQKSQPDFGTPFKLLPPLNKQHTHL